MFTNSINKNNPTGEARPLRNRTGMTIIIGSGKRRRTFDRPMDDLGREHMAEEIKAALFRPELLHAAGVKL